MYRLLHRLQAGLQGGGCPLSSCLSPAKAWGGQSPGKAEKGPLGGTWPKGCGQRPGDGWARAASHQAPGPSWPSSRGVAPAVTPPPDDLWPWKMGLAPPGASKSQAQGHLCASEEPWMQSGACRTQRPVPCERGPSCPQTLSSAWASPHQ